MRTTTTLTLVAGLVLFCASAAMGQYKDVFIDAKAPGVSIVASRGCGAQYDKGDLLALTVTADRDGYVSVLDFAPSGQVLVLFPNQYHPDNRMSAGVPLAVPAASDSFSLRFGSPGGEEILVAILTEKAHTVIVSPEALTTTLFEELRADPAKTARSIVGSLGALPSGEWWALDVCAVDNGSPSLTAPTCAYLVGALRKDFDYAGGSDGITVNTSPSASCSWTAVSDDPWITITAGSAQGKGSGVAYFTVAANPDRVPRTGSIAVAGKTVTVTQDAAPAVAATPATPPPVSGWALFIGVDKYVATPYVGEDGGRYVFRQLKYCVLGAREMAEALREQFPVQKLLLDEDVTYDSIRSAIVDWLAQLPPEADALIYFAGHGSIATDLDGDESDKYDETIVPYDYSVAHQFVTDDDLKSWLSSVKANRLLMIFDSCHSGTMDKGADAVRTATRISTGSRLVEPYLVGTFPSLNWILQTGVRDAQERRLVISACNANESAYESSSLQSGVLTYFLLTGLQGQADADGDGEITLQELFDYASVLVTQMYPWQHPQLVDGIGEPVPVRILQ